MSDHPQDGVSPVDPDVTRPQPETPGPSRTIGPYRLLHLIGEGGMGDVWLAEQTHPVRRQVALKVIKAGMDTRQVVARFEAERQALALMDHPVIATVFDGGSTPEGRPYFVMEYVKGEPITTYCDEQRLGMKDRLALFIQVCEGVQHAHQKGIIHRDLKPSNVLVTLQDGKPVPKIIDFGVAKATTKHLTERTLYTELGVMMGTPEYMSPEQAHLTGLDIDTRSDVYALGVLLYELLTGALPFDRKLLREKALDEIQRTIREIDPPKPSTRVTQMGPASTDAARNRHTEARRLASELRGDLDWITMKCLEKDRTRRYGSASDLAADIRRHLESQPVLASPPRTAYKVRKFVRRHRFGVLASAVIAIALVGGIVGTTLGLLRAVAAERNASEEAESAKQVSDFLVGLFRISDPNEAKGNAVTAREILDRGAEKIERELAGQPRVQQRLMSVMGGVYGSLGLYKTATSLQEKALEVARGLHGPEDLAVARLELDLAWFYRAQGRRADAISLCRHALSVYQKALGEAHAETARPLRMLGILLRDTGDYAEAQRLLETSAASFERARGPDDKEVAYSLYHLGWLLRLTGRFQEAKATYERALRIFETTTGADNTAFAWCLNDLAVVNENLHDYDAARRLQERALAIKIKIAGPDHPDVAASLNNLGVLWWRLHDYRQAADVCERALAIREKTFGPNHPAVAGTLENLGLIYADLGDTARARQCYERALAIAEEARGPDHLFVAEILCNSGEFSEKTHDLPAAAKAYERALAIYERAPGVNPDNLAGALFGVARVTAARGDLARAEGLFARLLPMVDGVARNDNALALQMLGAHTAVLRRMGHADRAAEIDARAETLRTRR